METIVINRVHKTGFFSTENIALFNGLVKATGGDDLSFVELAANPKTPVRILKALFETGNENLIEALTENPCLPLSLAKKILAQGNSDNEFVESVMENCKITLELFDAIVKRLEKNNPDGILFDLFELAKSPKTSVAVIRKCYRLALKEETSESPYHSKRVLLWGILQNPRTPSDLIESGYALYLKVLSKLYVGEANAEDRMRMVHEANEHLAAREDCPPTVFYRIMQTGNTDTKLVGAMNPLLFHDSRKYRLLQEKLWHDKSASDITNDLIWERMVKNVLCSEHYLTEFAKIKSDRNLGYLQEKILLETDFPKAIDASAAIRILETLRTHTNNKNVRQRAATRIETFQEQLRKKLQNKRSPKKK